MSNTDKARKMLEEAAATKDRLLRNALIGLAKEKYENEIRRLLALLEAKN